MIAEVIRHHERAGVTTPEPIGVDLVDAVDVQSPVCEPPACRRLLVTVVVGDRHHPVGAMPAVVRRPMVRLALDGTGGPVAVDGERRRPNLMVGGLVAMKALHSGTDHVETDT